MPVPSLTEDQRLAALAKASAIRKERSELRGALRAGTTSLHDVLGSSDEVVTRMRVSALLDALPGVGKTRAAQIMKRLDIAANRRVGGLGVHQRRALIAEFERRSSAQRARSEARMSRPGSSSSASGSETGT